MQDITPVEVRALPTSSVTLHSEVIIDRPAKQVWPLLFKYAQWNPEHIGAKVTRVAGTPEQEGDIVLEYKKSAEGYLPPIVIEIIKIIPYRKIVWKLYEPQAPENINVCFADFALEEKGRKTRFVYNSYSEIFNGKKPKEIPPQQRVTEILASLKRYVETR